MICDEEVVEGLLNARIKSLFVNTARQCKHLGSTSCSKELLDLAEVYWFVSINDFDIDKSTTYQLTRDRSFQRLGKFLLELWRLSRRSSR